MTTPDLSNEEFARRGNEMFEREIRPQLGAEREAHEFVAIDIEAGEIDAVVDTGLRRSSFA